MDDIAQRTGLAKERCRLRFLPRPLGLVLAVLLAAGSFQSADAINWKFWKKKSEEPPKEESANRELTGEDLERLEKKLIKEEKDRQEKLERARRKQERELARRQRDLQRQFERMQRDQKRIQRRHATTRKGINWRFWERSRPASDFYLPKQ